MSTDKQRKFLWIAPAVVAAIYLSPSLIRFAVQATANRQPVSAAAHAKPSPIRLAPPGAASAAPYSAAAAGQPAASTATAPASVADTSAGADFSKLLGVWTGNLIQQSGGLCKFRLEMRMSPDKPGDYSGYWTRSCMSAALFADPRFSAPSQRANLVNQLNPVSAILTGSAVEGSIAFHVDKTIGVPPDGCAPTTLTISPFGDYQIAAQESPCQGGQMLLARAAK
jgi:hypothetical protein